MKLCWDTAMAIHCCVVCGCFCTTMAKVSSCKGDICLMNPKTFINTISLLTEDICLPDYKQLLWRPWYCCIFRSWEKASIEHVLMCECWVCRQRDPMLLKRSRDTWLTSAGALACQKIQSTGYLIEALADATSAGYHVWMIYCMLSAVLTSLPGVSHLMLSTVQ